MPVFTLGGMMAILVVDDDLQAAELVQERFEAEGHSCLTAKDIVETELILQHAQVDSIALEMGILGRHPLEWLESLCLERPELTRCTVLITDRDLRPSEVMRVQACGAGILQRPFRLSELESAILGRLGRTRSWQRPRESMPRSEHRRPRPNAGKEDQKP
jgi:DNA-binding response OmpR family regulator